MQDISRIGLTDDGIRAIVKETIEKDFGSLPPGGGGSMEARVAKLEAAVEHILRETIDIKLDIRDIKKDIREDFRILFGSLIITALGLAGLMAKGFKWF